jgi:hypothetical protein
MTNCSASEEDLNRTITDEHLVIIAGACCEKWMSLPPFLGLKTIVAKDIESASGDQEEKRLKFLRKWNSIKGRDATYKQLTTALAKIKCGNDVDIVCAILKNSKPPTPPPSTSPHTPQMPSSAPLRAPMVTGATPYISGNSNV